MLKPLTKLNFMQFFSATNENYYKMLVAFFLISLAPHESISEIMSHTGFLFLIPFLLFSTPGGVLADRFSKTKVIIVTRFIEFFLMLLALWSFAISSKFGCQFTLFLLATTSALFGPSKYGIIPEIHPRSKLLFANSLIAAFTFFGIILGTGGASIFIDDSKSSIAPLYLCLLLTFLSLLISFFLPKTIPAVPDRKFSPFLYKELFLSFIEIRHIPKLLPATFAYAYFLFIGVFLQLNIIHYSVQILSITPANGGFLFLLSAIGMGIGAYTSAILTHGKIRLQLIPLSGLFISILFALLGLGFKNLAIAGLFLTLLGFFGGIFLVPAQTFILKESPEATRGRDFSTANFSSYLLALFAPLLLSIFILHLHFSPSSLFLAVALLNTLVMYALHRAFKSK